MGQERERIEQMFKSGDEGLVKLARLLCHKMRINYYVIVKPVLEPFAAPLRGQKIVKRISYSLEQPTDRDPLGLWQGLKRKVYEIKLDKKWNN